MSQAAVNTCPCCQERIGASEPSVVCSACGAVQHERCWQINGKCGTFGCNGRPLPVTGAAPVQSSPSGDQIEVVLHGSSRSKSSANKICPYCQTPITAGTDIVCCPQCDMPHHAECWRDNGGCTTFGCTGVGDVRSGVRANSNDIRVDRSRRIIIDSESLNEPWIPPSRETWSPGGVALAAKILVAAVVFIIIVASIWSASDHHDYTYNPYGSPGNSDSATQSSGTTPPVKWAVQLTGLGDQTKSALIGNRLYLATSGSMRVLNAKTGDTKWQSPIDSRVDEDFVVDGQYVYVTSDHVLYEFDASTGFSHWSYGRGLYLDAGPVYADGNFFYCARGRLCGYARKRGTRIWALPLVAATWNNAKYAVEAHGSVVLARYSGQSGPYTLVGADARTGRKLWQMSDVCGDTVGGGVLYYGQLDGAAHAVSIATGKEIWSFQSHDRYWYEPAVIQGSVFMATRRYLFCLNKQTGKRRWKFDFGGTPSGDGLHAAPFVVNGLVFISDGSVLHAVSLRTGRQKWHHSVEASLRPVTAEYWPELIGYKSGALYIVEAQSYIAGIDMSSGETIWYQGMGASVTSHLFIDDGRMFIGTGGGSLQLLKVSGKG